MRSTINASEATSILKILRGVSREKRCVVCGKPIPTKYWFFEFTGNHAVGLCQHCKPAQTVIYY